jgi:DNA-binding CsgD family transcriptional regulator
MAVAAAGFVGREQELSVLAGLLDALAASGRGAAVLVEGEAGIGKTALLERGLAEAEAFGCTVLWAYCDELTQRLPLSVMLEALKAADGADAAEPGEPSGAGRGSALSMRMAVGDPVMAEIERLLGLVDRLCALGPVVLAVEDLHWADEATLLLWGRLARSTGQLPLLLVGSCRPVPKPDELDRIRGELRPTGRTIGLDGLPAAAVARLAEQRLGFVPGQRLAEQLVLAAGNPLYTRELLDALVRSGGLRSPSGAAGPIELVAEQPREAVLSLSLAIADRLDFLTDGARDTLRLTALLGRSFAAQDVSLVTGLAPERLRGVLEEAIAAGVLERDGERLRFRHGLLRQVLYETVPAPIRAALHQQVIQALIAAAAPAERVAELLLPVLDEATGWELDWIAAHAQPLADRAPEAAAQLLEHALGHLTYDDPRRPTATDTLLAVAYYLGRFEQAEQLAAEILAGMPDPERTGQTSYFRARTRMGRADQPGALEVLDAALAGDAVAELWRWRLTAVRATILTSRDRGAQARADAESVLAASTDRLASAQAVHALSLLEPTTTEMQRLIDRGLALLGEHPEGAALRIVMLGNRFAGLADLDRFAEAERSGREVVALAERSHAPRLAAGLRVQLVDVLYQQGRWDDAQTELELAVRQQDIASPQAISIVHALQLLIAGHRDEHAEAARLAGLLASRTGSAASNGANALVLMARLLQAERSGLAEPVERALREILAAPDSMVFSVTEQLLPSMTRAARQLGNAELAQAVDELRGRAVPDADRPETKASDAWSSGLSAGDPAPIVSALAYYRRSGRLPMLGNALEDAAVLQAETGDAAAARTSFGEALETYNELGAVWDSRRAAGRLRSFGVRTGVRGVRRRPRTGWLSLTDTERQVADLVAQGLSNPDIAVRLFLSRRTVEKHVSHILGKLQLSSRRDVAKVREA